MSFSRDSRSKNYMSFSVKISYWFFTNKKVSTSLQMLRKKLDERVIEKFQMQKLISIYIICYSKELVIITRIFYFIFVKS